MYKLSQSLFHEENNLYQNKTSLIKNVVVYHMQVIFYNLSNVNEWKNVFKENFLNICVSFIVVTNLCIFYIRDIDGSNRFWIRDNDCSFEFIKTSKLTWTNNIRVRLRSLFLIDAILLFVTIGLIGFIAGWTILNRALRIVNAPKTARKMLGKTISNDKLTQSLNS